MSAAAHTRPSVLEGIVVALAAALGGGALIAALLPLVGSEAAARSGVTATALGYVLYLLARTPERTGRVTTVVLAVALSAAAWLAGVPFTGYVLLAAGALWLVRSLYFHAGALVALADLGLTVLAACFAAWAASRTGSPALVLWCFFLAQAFWTLLPASLVPSAGGSRAPPATADDAAFARARRAAEAALTRLAASR